VGAGMLQAAQAGGRDQAQFQRFIALNSSYHLVGFGQAYVKGLAEEVGSFNFTAVFDQADDLGQLLSLALVRLRRQRCRLASGARFRAQ
jgi:hypothetical protein